MTEIDTRSALAGGLGGGVGSSVAAVSERSLAVSFPVGMVIAAAVGIVVAVGLLFVICD